MVNSPLMAFFPWGGGIGRVPWIPMRFGEGRGNDMKLLKATPHFFSLPRLYLGRCRKNTGCKKLDEFLLGLFVV